MAATIPLPFVLSACTGSNAASNQSAATPLPLPQPKRKSTGIEAIQGNFVTEPLSGSVKGKTIIFAEPSFPIAKTIGAALDQAAGTLGMTDHQTGEHRATPDTVSAGMDQVVRDKPDAVTIVAFDPNTFWKTQAKKMA
jgi:hypothetical protein